MVFPKARAGAAALLFLLWLGYLAYLVATARNPIVVSRPQILVADLCVLARIDEQERRPVPTILVINVLWSADDTKTLEGQHVILPGLAELERPQGWTGAGEYLLALSKRIMNTETTYDLTPVPVMPGFHPATANETRIYRATADVVRQFRELKPGL